MKINLEFDDISLYPTSPSNLKSRSEVVTERIFSFDKQGRELSGNSIIAANMDIVGTTYMAKSLAKQKCFTAIHKYNSDSDVLNLLDDPEVSPYVFYTIGMNKESLEQTERLSKLIDFNKLQVCFEVANGYMQSFLDTIANFSKKFPKCIIMAGNIISPELIPDYVQVGVDIIKVGIGNGAACTTSRVAGIGIPQYSLVDIFGSYKEFYKNSKNKFLLCSDGGCKTPGDVVKALAGNADFVMLGKMLAGTDESATVKILNDNNTGICEYYGMSSRTAMLKHNENKPYRTAEGKVIEIPYTGPVSHTIDEILGGIRSACSYLNFGSVKELPLAEKRIIK